MANKVMKNIAQAQAQCHRRIVRRIVRHLACVLICFRAAMIHAQNIDDKSDERLETAEEMIEAGLHNRAILLYQEILQDELAAGQVKPVYLQMALQTRFLLAQALIASERYQEALSFLEENINTALPLSNELEEVRKNSIYLLALAYKNMQQYDLAKNTLRKYLNFEGPHPLPLREEAHFQIGLINYLNGSMDEARSQFENLEAQATSPRLNALSKLYLARIFLVMGNHSAVMPMLDNLALLISPDDDLRFELSSLQGEACFLMQDFQKAAQFFERSMPKNHQEKCSWYGETLYHLGWSYLNLGDAQTTDQEIQHAYLLKAEAAFQRLLEVAPEDRVYLALGQCYLSRAALLKEEQAYAQAEALLSQQELFSSREAQSHAILLRAEAASSYEERDKFYRQLTQEANKDSPFFAKGWYLRALNDFDEGKFLQESGKLEESAVILERSKESFKKSFELLKEIDKPRAAAALKYQALAAGYRDNHDANTAAFSILDELINERPSLLYAVDSPDEIFYLHGFFAARLFQSDGGEKYAELAKQSLRHAAEFPNSKFGGDALNHLGALQYRRGHYAEAEASYCQLIRGFPSSPYTPDAWFWAACCADKLLQDPAIGQQRRRHIFENYPDAPIAAEAFFTLYTYQDYLQGGRTAIKHLQSFIKKFPDSPLLIQSYFLIGLDYKRDRKTAEGKWIRKKSLTESIDAFQNAEAQFDCLMEKGLIPSGQLDYYTAIYYRAILEKAMANLAIAEESSGAKQQIYLEYAEEVFKRLVDEFTTLQHQHTKLLFQGENFPPIYEESSFWLAQTHIKEKNDEAGERILSAMLSQYRQSKITRGYYLSRVWFEQGAIALRRGEHAMALRCLKHAEDAAKGNVLGTDQKLDLWIQQSMCYRELGQLDDAILILSKAINDDAVSALRLKAMYLRAEIYELQKRPELARKQLDSVAKKGGIWALKAKEKLEKEYGY